MNKTELIAALAEKSIFTKSASELAVNTLLEILTEELKKGEKIQLVGFGTFEVVEKLEREGRNPRTGEKTVIAACKQPKFKAGKKLKDAVNV